MASILSVRYGKDDPPMELRVSERHVALGGREGSETWREVPPKGRRAFTLPDQRVQIVDATDTEGGAAGLILESKADPSLQFAGTPLEFPNSGEPVFYTEHCFVQFMPGTQPERQRELLDNAGMEVVQAFGFASDAFWTRLPQGTGRRTFDIAASLLEYPEVRYSYPELQWNRRPATLYPEQWTLHRTAVGGVLVDAHASLADALQVTRGHGTTVAVIDDGFCLGNAELEGKAVHPWDFSRASSQVRPDDRDDRHGTACAGVAVGAGRVRMSGTAPEAKLMPLRVNAGLGSFREAMAFEWAANKGADVISCSWTSGEGRPGVAPQKYPIPPHTRLAIDYATTHGRGGKGCLVVFAAGNGNESADLDGYPSHREVVAVSACNANEVRSSYSDYGECVFCCFPSDDPNYTIEGQSPRVFTLDIGPCVGGGAAYRADFGGTSSACAGVAGVAALVLSIAPDLTMAELKALLARSCERIDASSKSYGVNGRSPLYGYGRLNAAHAVQAARQAAYLKQLPPPLPEENTCARNHCK